MLSDVVGQGGKLPIGFEYVGLGIDMAKGDLNNSTDKNHFWLTLNISKVLIFFLYFILFYFKSFLCKFGHKKQCSPRNLCRIVAGRWHASWLEPRGPDSNPGALTLQFMDALFKSDLLGERNNKGTINRT